MNIEVLTENKKRVLSLKMFIDFSKKMYPVVNNENFLGINNTASSASD